MNILISNDDGVNSPGILKLAERFKELGRVVVVAPHRERSTAGHALTLHKPLRIEEVSKDIYSTSGTPADCVYLGVREVFKAYPDLILSGINMGANLGTDIHYSGTVAAAREAALLNLKSYAFSLVHHRQLIPEIDGRILDFEMAADFCFEVVQKTKDLKFPPHSFLNTNVPNIPREHIKGIKLARQGFRKYASLVTKRTDPRGKDYFWIGGDYLGFESKENCDCTAVGEKWVSVTPMTIDCTHEGFYTSLRDLF